jgi:pyruvate/2-oxoglutarate dehydrogenase complex dihydrolipoamide acyltransferase (E2) component
VRGRARDLGVDLATIRPAQGDRVRHSDLDAHLRYAATPPLPTSDAIEEVKVVGLRRRIAENMAEAMRAIPHFTYVEEVDVTALEATRAALNEGRGERPRLTLLPFLIRAIVGAVPAFPMINARYDDVANIVSRHAAVHLGIATQTENGLMVPVLRDAGGRDLWQLVAELSRLADAARAGRSTRGELSGSTITLTSLGALGGIVSTPVINRPEVAIVGVNRIHERPAVVDGRIEVRKLMNLSSSFDRDAGPAVRRRLTHSGRVRRLRLFAPSTEPGSAPRPGCRSRARAHRRSRGSCPAAFPARAFRGASSGTARGGIQGPTDARQWSRFARVLRHLTLCSSGALPTLLPPL